MTSSSLRFRSARPRLPLFALVAVATVAVPLRGEIYVTHTTNNSIDVYADDATGFAVPVRSLAGLSTLLDFPTDVALDLHRGELFVVNLSDSLTVYPLTADGDVAPLRTISGPATLLKSPSAVVVDVIHGEIFVANRLGASVRVYERTADGEVAPIRTISGLSLPSGLFLDLAHDELYVAENAGEVKVFSRTANGVAAPRRQLTVVGPARQAFVSLDDDELYVTLQSDNRVDTFARTASGSATPIRSLEGSATGLSLPMGLSFTTSGELLVVSRNNSSMRVFDRLDDGDVAPSRSITSSFGFFGLSSSLEPQTYLFFDGFEGGGTGAWSLSVGG